MYTCKHRDVFFAHNGPGPFACSYCSEEVTLDDTLVHHNDGNYTNNDLANLAPMHFGCHTKHHNARLYSERVLRAKELAAVLPRGTDGRFLPREL